MSKVDDILREILSLPDDERLALCDRIITAAASLPVTGGYTAEIDENQNLCSCKYSNITTPSILYATPIVEKNRIYDTSYKDSSYKDTYIKKENIKERKSAADDNPQIPGFVNDKNAAAVAEEWVKIYTDICKSYPQVAKITDTRIRLVAERSERFTADNFRAACQNMEDCDWIKGRGFGSFDWIVKSDENLTKLAEGYYNYRRKPISAGGTIKGRTACLVALIDQASRAFDKVVDAISLGKELETLVAKDRYYSQLTKEDFEEIFRKGRTRQYEYHGLTVAAFCSWMNAYKEEFQERQRRRQMAIDAANRK